MKPENRDHVQINCRNKTVARLFYEIEDELYEKGIIPSKKHNYTLHQILKDWAKSKGVEK
jgi:hypothetical protein